MDETTDTEYNTDAGGFGAGEYGGYDTTGEVDAITGYDDSHGGLSAGVGGFGEGEYGGYDTTGEIDPVTGYDDSHGGYSEGGYSEGGYSESDGGDGGDGTINPGTGYGYQYDDAA